MEDDVSKLVCIGEDIQNSAMLLKNFLNYLIEESTTCS